MVIIALGGGQRWLVGSLRLQSVSTLKLLAADHFTHVPYHMSNSKSYLLMVPGKLMLT